MKETGELVLVADGVVVVLSTIARKSHFKNITISCHIMTLKRYAKHA